MPTNALPENPPTTGDPISPGFFRTLFHASGTAQKKRQRLVALVSLGVLLLTVGIGVLMFSALSAESQSYRDGYSVGGSIYSLDSAGEGAQEACQLAEVRAPSLGGRPHGDDPSQWLHGCRNAFESAQADN